jgi:hypothetical protein
MQHHSVIMASCCVPARITAITATISKEFTLFRLTLLQDYCRAFQALSQREKAYSSPPSENAIVRAWELFCLSNARHLPPTNVVPSLEGGVGVCFAHNGKYADLECLNSNGVLGVVSDRQGHVDTFDVNPSNEADVDNAIFRIKEFIGCTENTVPGRAAGCV